MPVLDRRLIAVIASALLLAGCPEPIPEPACGDLKTFDLSACDRSTLAQVALGGIFNANVSWASGGSSAVAMYTVVPGGERIDGHPARSKLISSESLYLGTTFTEG